MTTEAGKALLRSDFDTTGWGPNVVREHVTKAVAAIEAEAVAAERTRIAAIIRRHVGSDDIYQVEDDLWYSRVPGDVLASALADVLALVEKP